MTVRQHLGDSVQGFSTVLVTVQQHIGTSATASKFWQQNWPVRLDSDPIIPLPLSLSVTSSGASASGDRHQRDLPSYVAQSVQPPARSLSSSSSTRGRRCTRSMFASLRRRLRGGVDVDVVCAADAARLRNVTYLLRAQLTASRSPPPSFTASR